MLVVFFWEDKNIKVLMEIIEVFINFFVDESFDFFNFVIKVVLFDNIKVDLCS